MDIQQSRAGFGFFRQHLLDLFLPRVCVGCGQVGCHFCERCVRAVVTPSAFWCPGCLQPSYRGRPCVRCVKSSSLDALWVCGSYRQPSFRQAIEAFKYDGVVDLVGPLSVVMRRYVVGLESSGIALGSFDAVVPVPLHRRKFLFRGYNQTELLARRVCQLAGWPLRTDMLARRHWTASQVKLGPRQRQDNVCGAFAASAAVAGRSILLIDDVVTTGSTLQECARALRQAGARSVTALALAHG